MTFFPIHFPMKHVAQPSGWHDVTWRRSICATSCTRYICCGWRNGNIVDYKSILGIWKLNFLNEYIWRLWNILTFPFIIQSVYNRGHRQHSGRMNYLKSQCFVSVEQWREKDPMYRWKEWISSFHFSTPEVSPANKQNLQCYILFFTKAKCHTVLGIITHLQELNPVS